jgi:hypothetical protein
MGAAPKEIPLPPQLLLVHLADLLEDLPRAIQVRDLPACLGNLIGMEGDLTGFRARIIHIQDPLMMALTASAGGAGDSRRMKRTPFEHRAAKKIVERRKLREQCANGLVLVLS